MFGLLVFLLLFVPVNQLWFAIVSGAQVCQAVYIALCFALLTLFRTKKNKETKKRKRKKKRKEKRKEKKKVKRQYNADRNSNSLNSFQTLAKQRKIKVNQSVSAVLCGLVSIINSVLYKITT